MKSQIFFGGLFIFLLILSCAKDDDKKVPENPTTIPNELSGNVRRKMGSSRSLPEDKDINKLLNYRIQLIDNTPDLELFDKEYLLKNNSPKDKSSRLALEKSIQERKNDLSVNQLNLHKMMLDNCNYKNIIEASSIPQKLQKGTQLKASKTSVLNSRENSTCPLNMEYKSEMVESVTEISEDQSKMGLSIKGMISASGTIPNLQIQDRTQLKSFKAQGQITSVTRSQSGEFGGGYHESYSVVDGEINLDMKFGNLMIQMSSELLDKNNEGQMEALYKIEGPGMDFELFISTHPSTETQIFINGKMMTSQDLIHLKEKWGDKELDDKKEVLRPSLHVIQVIDTLIQIQENWFGSYSKVLVQPTSVFQKNQ